MTNLTFPDRAALLAMLVSKAPGQKLGRTAIMKFLYFLQVLKSVPLGYDFRLHTYGPFESDVLSDLATATSQNVVNEATVSYPKGYGYAITPSARSVQMATDLATNRPDLVVAVDEILAAFGSLSAAELELSSTILFVDREFAQLECACSSNVITEQVRKIKPHFTEPTIQDRVNDFRAKGWLRSVLSDH